MKYREKTVVAAICLAAVLLVSGRVGAQAQEVITNDSVIQMVVGKVPRDLILAKIHSTPNTFDVTATGLVSLTKSKVDKEVIKEMIKTPAKTESKEVLSNDAVVVMVTGNVARDVIILKIQSAKTKFDLTSTGLVGLNQNKVPQDVVKAMLNVVPTPPEPEPTPAPTGRAATGAATPAGRAAAAGPAADSQGTTFTATGTLNAVYDKIKNRLTKSGDTTIHQSDPVLGQISATRVFQEGGVEHESRIVVRVSSVSGRTTVRVSVFDKSRRTVTPPARWSIEKFDSDMTLTVVTDLRNILAK